MDGYLQPFRSILIIGSEIDHGWRSAFGVIRADLDVVDATKIDLIV